MLEEDAPQGFTDDDEKVDVNIDLDELLGRPTRNCNNCGNRADACNQSGNALVAVICHFGGCPWGKVGAKCTASRVRESVAIANLVATQKDPNVRLECPGWRKK